MVERSIKVHEIAVDGLPPRYDDDFTGRVAFIFDGCIVSGWPLYSGEDYDQPPYSGYYEAQQPILQGVFQDQQPQVHPGVARQEAPRAGGVMSDQSADDLTDLRSRLDNANRQLAYQANLSNTSPEEATRLRGKAEGVRLAMSYLDEIVRTARA